MGTLEIASRLGVLLVEDDDDDALIVQDLLEDQGAAVDLVRGRTLDEALALLPGDIGCVLLDLHLPDATGVESVERIREAAPWLAVIVLTGLDDELAGEDAVQAGAQDFLVKGQVTGPLLARAIRYAVGRRHAEDVLAQLRIAELRADETARLERALVPHPIVSSPDVWVASRYLPGRRRALIGGDFFDVVEISSTGAARGHLHVVMGDVSGRGPDEAALGAGLRIAWRALTLSGASPETVPHTLQRMIEAERQDGGTFATLCTLELDPVTRTLNQRRAGHPAPLLVTQDTVRSLPVDGGGPPIGMFRGAEWPVNRFSLPEDWAVLLYTDGLIEARDGKGGLLGEDGLQTLIGERIGANADWRADPGRLLREVVDAAQRCHGEPFSDDVALLALGTRGEPEVRRDRAARVR
jgi:serine phosphatase RsbU (regulator of sigma subunit)